MNVKNKSREKILNQPAYWIEGINGHLYDAIVNYMEINKLNQTKLAEHLGVSKGRISQILNDGNINFSLEKIIEISLKVGKYPVFNFEDKQIFIDEENEISGLKVEFFEYNLKDMFHVSDKNQTREETKIIQLSAYTESKSTYSYGN